MIKIKDILLRKVAYPDENSGLAKKSHMYICVLDDDSVLGFVKCQSYKPQHNNPNTKPLKRLLERPNKLRNPFDHPTLLDLDKLFVWSKEIFAHETAWKVISEDLYDDLIACINFDRIEYIQETSRP